MTLEDVEKLMLDTEDALAYQRVISPLTHMELFCIYSLYFRR